MNDRLRMIQKDEQIADLWMEVLLLSEKLEKVKSALDKPFVFGAGPAKKILQNED